MLKINDATIEIIADRIVDSIRQGRMLKEDAEGGNGWQGKENLELLWYSYIKRVDPHEKRYIVIIKSLLTKQAKEVFDKIKRYPNDYKKWMFDKKKWLRELTEAEAKFIVKLYKQEGQKAIDLALKLSRKSYYKAEEIPISIAFDVYNPEVTEAIVAQTTRFPAGVVGTSEEIIRREIANGLELGESIDKLRKRVIRRLGPDYIKNRSEMIARSETIYASNAGAELGYMQSGVVEGKKWLTALDERTCDPCTDMNNMTAPLGQPTWEKEGLNIGDVQGKYGLDFDFTEGAMPHPPLHPRCRCTITPIAKMVTKKPPRRGHLKKMSKNDSINLMMSDAKAKGIALSREEASVMREAMTGWTSQEYYRYIRLFQTKGEGALRSFLSGKGFSAKKIETLILNTKKYSEAMEKYISIANKYLDKNVYRGIYIEKPNVEKLSKIFKEGSIQDMAGTSSWSSKLQQANEKGNVIFKAKNSSGTSIRHMTKWTVEDELIFSKNMKFKILNVEKMVDADGISYYIVNLKEMPLKVPKPVWKPTMTTKEAELWARKYGVRFRTDITSISLKDMNKVNAQIAKMPEKYMLKGKAKGLKLEVVTNSGVTIHPNYSQFKGVTPRGWPEGTSWDTVPGIATPLTKETIIVGNKLGTGHGSINLVLHEHAHNLSTNIFKSADTAKDFIKIHTANKKAGLIKSAYEQWYAEEYWAECFARYYQGPYTRKALLPRNVIEYFAKLEETPL